MEAGAGGAETAAFIAAGKTFEPTISPPLVFSHHLVNFSRDLPFYFPLFQTRYTYLLFFLSL